jgi:hypothetical protein
MGLRFRVDPPSASVPPEKRCSQILTGFYPLSPARPRRFGATPKPTIETKGAIHVSQPRRSEGVKKCPPMKVLSEVGPTTIWNLCTASSDWNSETASVHRVETRCSLPGCSVAGSVAIQAFESFAIDGSQSSTVGLKVCKLEITLTSSWKRLPVLRT